MVLPNDSLERLCGLTHLGSSTPGPLRRLLCRAVESAKKREKIDMIRETTRPKCRRHTPLQTMTPAAAGAARTQRLTEALFVVDVHMCFSAGSNSNCDGWLQVEKENRDQFRHILPSKYIVL